METSPLVVVTLAFAAGVAAGYRCSWPLSLLGLVTGLAVVGAALLGAAWAGGFGRPRSNPAGTTAVSPPASSTKTVPPDEHPAVDGAAAGRLRVRAADTCRRLAPLLVVALFFFLGAAWARADAGSKKSALLDDLHTHLYLTGRVAEEPKVYANRTVYVLEAWEAGQGNWRETLKEKVELVVYPPIEGPANAAAWEPADEGIQRVQEARGAAAAAVAYAAEVDQAAEKPGSNAPAFATPRPTSRTVAAHGPCPVYRYGDVLRVYGQLRLPPTARNPGEFDYRAYLARRGVFTRMSVQPADVRLLAHRPKNLILEWVYGIKTRALAVIESALPAREAGTLAAVLFGDQERLDEEDVEVYRTLGTYHVFAVSGQQVGFVLFLALVLARLPGGAPALQLALGGLLILFYMVLTGFTPSVTRAGIMALVGLGAMVREEETDPYTALAAATLVILLWRPYELLGPGLLLSLAAAWGIIYLNPTLEAMASALPPWRKYLTVTVAAQAGVAWLIAYYFQLFSPGALLANLLVLPAIGAVTILGVLLIPLAGLWPPVAGALTLACGGLLDGLGSLLGALSEVRGLALAVPRPGAWSAALYFGGLILAREAWCRRARIPWKRLWPVPVTALLLALLAACLLPGAPRLEAVFLDVGQGDAIYLRTPGGRHVLIDAGGPPPGRQSDYDPGAKTVVPFLQRRGVRHLDLVISTHPHSDHLRGLFSVLEKIPASLVLLPPRGCFGGPYDSFAAFLEAQHLPYREAKRGDRILLDPEVELAILHPPSPGGNSGATAKWTENDYSLAVKCTYGQTSLLLTGDIQAAAMEDLMQTSAREGLPAHLKSTALKVPHHGSANGLAEDFLAAADPRAVVISVGEGNDFGHPSPQVLAFWRARSVPIYRTDEHGAVTFISDGRRLAVRTALP